MRDYIRYEATFRDGAFAFPRLRRVIQNWLIRRSLRKMEMLDDYILADIGLTRSELYHGQRLPYDVDPMAEILRLRDRRVAGRRYA